MIGVAVVAACTLLGARLLAGADDTVAVWAAGATLGEGQQVGTGDLVARRVRFVDQRDADRYLPASDALPEGVTLARAVGAGELLPRAALGTRAAGTLTDLPLSVGTEAVPATVRVGSTVDVWVTADRATTRTGSGSGRRATLVLDDVRVVSAPPTGSSLGPTATRQVIVGVDEDQQDELPTSIAALAGGTVLLTVRR